MPNGGLQSGRNLVHTGDLVVHYEVLLSPVSLLHKRLDIPDNSPHTGGGYDGAGLIGASSGTSCCERATDLMFLEPGW